MELFDLREHDREEVLQVVMDRGTSKYQLTYDDRALQFFRTFVESTEKANYFEIPSADSWVFIPDKETFYPDTPIIDKTESCSFAFQPIVDPFACEIISWEALLRTPDGQSPGAYFAGLAGDDIYLADLHSKRVALSLAGKLGLRNKALSINLLPMTLVKVPNAVAFLLDEISRNDLIPEQIIVEFTEREVISRMDDFTDAVRKLKGAGISLAIDHFGAGFAGLSLLAHYQPDRIKIDHELIRNIHQDGPRQSIVQAIIKCCFRWRLPSLLSALSVLKSGCGWNQRVFRSFRGIYSLAPAWGPGPPSHGRRRNEPLSNSLNIFSSFFPSRCEPQPDIFICTRK